MTPFSLTVKNVSASTIKAEASNGALIEIPTSAIHGLPKEGETIRLIAVAANAEESGSKTFARTLLNELLADSSS